MWSYSEWNMNCINCGWLDLVWQKVNTSQQQRVNVTWHPTRSVEPLSSYFKAKVSENINIDFLEQGKSNLKLLPSRIQHCFTSGVNSDCKIHATYMIPDLFSFLVWQHIHKTYDTSPIFPVFLWAGFNFTLARRWPGIADVLASICFVQLELGLQFYWLWIMP